MNPKRIGSTVLRRQVFAIALVCLNTALPLLGQQRMNLRPNVRRGVPPTRLQIERNVAGLPDAMRRRYVDAVSRPPSTWTRTPIEWKPSSDRTSIEEGLLRSRIALDTGLREDGLKLLRQVESVAVAADSSLRAAVHVDLAREALIAGENAEARRCADEAVRSADDDAVYLAATMLRGSMRYQQADYRGAAEDFENYSHRETDPVAKAIGSFYALTCRMQLGDGEPAQMRSLCDGVIAGFANDASDDARVARALALYARGVLRLDAVDFYAAFTEEERAGLDDLNASIELAPSAEAYGIRGAMLYHKVGDKEASRLDFEKAIELDNTFDVAWYNLACWHALQGQENEALASLERAVVLRRECVEDALSDPDLQSVVGSPEFAALRSSANNDQLVQRALTRNGFETGRTDGVWDSASTTALKLFQTSANVSHSERWDDWETLSAMMARLWSSEAAGAGATNRSVAVVALALVGAGAAFLLLRAARRRA